MDRADSSVPHGTQELEIAQDVSIPMGKVNLLAIPVAIFPVLVLGVPYAWLWGTANLRTGLVGFIRPVSFLPVFLCGVVLHEFLHGIGWMYFGKKPFRALRFGFKLLALSPFAHCTEPLTAHAYKVGSFLPAFLLGLVPCGIAFLTGNGWFICFGILFTVAASGDFLILWIIRKVPADQLVGDHPSRAGCYIYSRRQNSHGTVC
jgi:hypothetical protein